MTGQPSVTADESKMSFPLVHVTCGYGPEVQPLRVASGPMLHLRRGHPQQRLVHPLRFQLFILAKLCHVYVVPQSTASMALEGIQR